MRSGPSSFSEAAALAEARPALADRPPESPSRRKNAAAPARPPRMRNGGRGRILDPRSGVGVRRKAPAGASQFVDAAPAPVPPVEPVFAPAPLPFGAVPDESWPGLPASVDPVPFPAPVVPPAGGFVVDPFAGAF